MKKSHSGLKVSRKIHRTDLKFHFLSFYKYVQEDPVV